MARVATSKAEVSQKVNFILISLRLGKLERCAEAYGFNCLKKRAMGIEPTWPAWKAGALPLSYAR